MASGQSEIECSLCGNVGVKTYYKPSCLEQRTSRISADGDTKNINALAQYHNGVVKLFVGRRSWSYG